MAKKEEKKVAAKAEAKVVAAVPAVQDTSGGAVVSDEDLRKYAGAGGEKVTSDDLTIPFIRIIQKLSPQLSKNKAEYIAEAEAGDIFNTATRDVYSGTDGIEIVPVFYMRQILQWAPNRGGLVNRFEVGETLPPFTKNEKGARIVALDGSELVDTYQYFVAHLDDGEVKLGMYSLSKSQAKVAKRWNGLLKNMKIPNSNAAAPYFMFSWTFKVVELTNDQGDWFGWDFAQGPRTPGPIFQACAKFYENVVTGKIKVSDPTPEDAASPGGEGEEDPAF